MNEIPKPEKLFEFSERTLQDLLMASRDRSARHLKAAKASWHEAVIEEAIAITAQYFLEHRAQMLEQARLTIEAQTVLEFPRERKTA